MSRFFMWRKVNTKRLEQRNNLGWLRAYAGAQYSPYKDNPGAGLTIGALLFSSILITGSANYYMTDKSLGISIGAGFLF